MFGGNKDEGENTVTEAMKEKNVPNEVGPGEIAVQPTVPAKTAEEDAPKFDIDEDKPGKEVPAEVPIEYFLSPVNRRVNVATPELMGRKDLIPCTKEGKKVYDYRIF